MTNKEALNRCKLMVIDKNFWSAENQIALNMAIKALEQQPCEDAISRHAVLDYVDKIPSELTADGRRMIRRRTLEEYISDSLPSVKALERDSNMEDMTNGDKL